MKSKKIAYGILVFFLLFMLGSAAYKEFLRASNYDPTGSGAGVVLVVMMMSVLGLVVGLLLTPVRGRSILIDLLILSSLVFVFGFVSEIVGGLHTLRAMSENGSRDMYSMFVNFSEIAFGSWALIFCIFCLFGYGVGRCVDALWKKAVIKLSNS